MCDSAVYLLHLSEVRVVLLEIFRKDGPHLRLVASYIAKGNRNKYIVSNAIKENRGAVAYNIKIAAVHK